jgi:hypothetical protein
VRVIIGPDGEKLLRPYDVNLWETGDDVAGAKAVISPVDAATVGIDPLTYL